MDIIKHIVLFFISPLNLVILFFVLGVLLSKQQGCAAKTFKFASLFSFFLFTQPYFSDLLLYPLEHKHKYPNVHSNSEKPDYIFVLACYYSTFGDVPEISRWSECSMQRNIEAFKLYKMTGAPIIISGGNFLHDPDVNYSIRAKDYFLHLGVEEESLIITKIGSNTHEEFVSTAPYLRNSHTWVVSSATHIRRLQKLFSNQNYSALFFPVNHHTKGLLTPYITLPSSRALLNTEIAFYEYAALSKQALFFQLNN